MLEPLQLLADSLRFPKCCIMGTLLCMLLWFISQNQGMLEKIPLFFKMIMYFSNHLPKICLKTTCILLQDVCSVQLDQVPPLSTAV